ncbi:hypothetical protein [Sphingomonas sp. MA1305]|uniref:hypothetical protein n=1 Tax=Sphingomonas sp. MA1305 TaxID=2479204 RepID=UPI0018DF66CB|nr:hypothetical protein [Sphingomonas sp. MA1305]
MQQQVQIKGLSASSLTTLVRVETGFAQGRQRVNALMCQGETSVGVGGLTSRRPEARSIVALRRANQHDLQLNVAKWQQSATLLACGRGPA